MNTFRTIFPLSSAALAARFCICLALGIALLACLAPGVEAQPPFLQPPATSPAVTTPHVASPMGGSTALEPSLLASNPALTQGSFSSSPPVTALDPRPGTGSPSGTGLLAPPKVDPLHPAILQDGALLAKLKEAMEKLPSVNPQVNISPNLPPEISGQLSSLLSLIKWLLWGGAGMIASVLGWKVGRPVVLAAAGLPSSLAAGSTALARLQALEQSLLQPSAPPAATPAAPSSTPGAVS